MSIKKPLLFTQTKNLLVNPQGRQHPLAEKRSLLVADLEGFRKGLDMEGVSFKAAKIILTQGRGVQQLIMNRLGISGLAGVVRQN